MANSINTTTADASKSIIKSGKSVPSSEMLFMGSEEISFEQMLSLQIPAKTNEVSVLTPTEEKTSAIENADANIDQEHLIDSLQLGFMMNTDGLEANKDEPIQAAVYLQPLPFTIPTQMVSIKTSDVNSSKSEEDLNQSTINQAIPTIKSNVVGNTSESISNTQVSTNTANTSSPYTSDLMIEKKDGLVDFTNMLKNVSKTVVASKDGLPLDSNTQLIEPQRHSNITIANKSEGITPIATTVIEHPGKSGWNEAIGQRVILMTQRAEQSATLTLNPPEMGQLDIVIEVNNNQAEASFLSDRQEVRQALQDGMDNLRQMMKEAGITLGNTNIGERDSQKSHSPSTAHMGKADPESKKQESANSSKIIRTSLGMVDTYV